MISPIHCYCWQLEPNLLPKLIKLNLKNSYVFVLVLLWEGCSKVSSWCRSGDDYGVAHLLLTAYSNLCEVAWLSCMSSCPDKSIQLVGKEQEREKMKRATI